MKFSQDILISLIHHHRPDLGAPIEVEPIATGKFNRSFWVRAAGEEMVLRVAPPRDAVFVFYERDMMRQEPGLHERLRAETSAPVPEILVFDASHRLLERDFMLMARLPGRPLSEMRHVDNDTVLRQVGQYLAEVHRLQATQHGYLGAHQPMVPQSRWVEAFAIMWNKLIDDVVGVGHYDAQESRFLRHLLEQHLPLFDRPVAASLLHMDIWAQNILVDDTGRVTGLIDWDRALWGDPEIEFAVLDYCGISEPAFWEGYGQERDWSPEARIRQVFYLLYELQKYIVIREGRLHDSAGARRYKNEVMGIVQEAFLG
ncbi:MAG: phosphotransferase family protein [Ardenticatenaceae bacterium]